MPTTRKSYVYDKGDYVKMKQKLNIDWEEVLSEKNVQEAMDP